MKSKNIILLIVLLICGILVGSLVASATKNVHYLSWLAYAVKFGIDANKPALINLSVIRIAFGAEINISAAQIACLLLAALLYRRLR